MNIELSNKLYNTDPIFYDDLLILNEEDHSKYLYIECEDGWFQPLLELSKNTAFLNSILKDRKIPAAIKTSQIKEKFGELTVYGGVHITTDKISPEDSDFCDKIHDIYTNLVTYQTLRCWNICEFCGKSTARENPIVTTKGWLKRVCKNCAEQKNLIYFK